MNSKRISILEEMVQTIYTEWFVNFRFPGYENVKFIDSEMGKIPNKWEFTTLGKILKDIEAPYFAFEYKDNTWHGEDFYFQKKLRDAGHMIFVDMNLSRQVQHVGQWAFGSSLTVNEEKRLQNEIIKKREK